MIIGQIMIVQIIVCLEKSPAVVPLPGEAEHVGPEHPVAEEDGQAISIKLIPDIM